MVLPKKYVEENVYDLARQRVRRIYEMVDNVAVSFSGGKDSTCALNVVVDVARELGRLPVRTIFWDGETIQDETVDFVRRTAQRPEVALEWYCFPLKRRNACSRKHPYWWCWAPEDRAKWVRDMPPEALTEKDLPCSESYSRDNDIMSVNRLIFDPKKGTHAFIIGLRAQESLKRYRVVAQRAEEAWITPDPDNRHVWLAKPVYDWMVDDIWTATIKFGWDYNRSYDALQALGVPRHEQRVGTPFGEEPLRGLYQYAQCWPELFERMAYRVPGCQSAARLARTFIYGGFGLEPLAGGEDPKERIKHELLRWEEPQRSKIRAAIQHHIQVHYDKEPGVPLPLNESGRSGVSWSYLLMIATRGDLKNRRDPTTRNGFNKKKVQRVEEK